jgi:hypothetical protein
LSAISPADRSLRSRGFCPVLAFALLLATLPSSAAARQQDAPADVTICSAEWLQGIRRDDLGSSPSSLLQPGWDGDLRSATAFAEHSRAAALSRTGPVPTGSDAPAGSDGIDQNTLPNDFAFQQRYQQNLRQMNAVEAWQISFGDPEVTIAIVADGVEIGHEDLAGKIWRNPKEVLNGIDDDGNGYVDDLHGWDFGEDDNDPSPIDDPLLTRGVPPTGTAMAGLAAAQTNNGTGIAGISWHARILPLKTPKVVQLADGPAVGGLVDDITEAVCYAVNAGARVIVVGGISLKFPDAAFQDLLETRQAIQHAWRQGAVVVAPAGECARENWWCPDAKAFGENPPSYPASLDTESLIGVAAYDKNNRQRDTASFGDWVDISAPGEGFYTTWRKSQYLFIGDNYPTPSDFAAAHVAGVAALMLAANPDFTPEMVEGKLCEFAERGDGVAYGASPGKRWPHNDHFGCGRLQAERTLEHMPWRPRVDPIAINIPVSDAAVRRCVKLSTISLNLGTYQLVGEKPWLSFEAQAQPAGERSATQTCIEVEGLLKEYSGRLMSGSAVCPVVEARVTNPDDPVAEARSPVQKIELCARYYSVRARVFLPVLANSR